MSPFKPILLIQCVAVYLFERIVIFETIDKFIKIDLVDTCSTEQIEFWSIS